MKRSDYLVDPLPDLFKCAVCTDVLRDPVQLPTADVCCNTCTPPHFLGCVTSVAKPLHMELMKLQCRCPHLHCIVSGPYGAILLHQQGCGWNTENRCKCCNTLPGAMQYGEALEKKVKETQEIAQLKAAVLKAQASARRARGLVSDLREANDPRRGVPVRRYPVRGRLDRGTSTSDEESD